MDEYGKGIIIMYKYGLEEKFYSYYAKKWLWNDLDDVNKCEDEEAAKELAQKIDIDELPPGSYRIVVWEIIGKDEDGYDELDVVWSKEFNRKLLTIWE